MSDPTGDPPKRIDFGSVVEDYEITREIPIDLMKEIIEDIILTCNLNQNRFVLELGCGAGRFLRELAIRKIPVAGIDISKGMLAKAFQNQQSRKYFRSHLIASDAISLPFPQGLFTGVIAIHLFHLFADWQQALSEVIRVLQPSGKLITGDIETPAPKSSLAQLYWRRRNEMEYPVKRPGAYLSEVLRDLKEMGATIETHEFLKKLEIPLQTTLTYLEQRVFSSMWDLPDVIHRQIMQEVRQYATSQFRSLNYQESVEITAELNYAYFG